MTDGCAFCDKNDLGRPMVAPTSEIEIVITVIARTNISMSLFTIKIETRGRLSVRVFLPRIDIKLWSGDIALIYISPKPFREYWLDLRTNPTPTPTGSSFGSFLSRKEQENPTPI